MKIFSIHNGINASVAYYANGKILEAVSEERFNKIKNYKGMPLMCINYILKKYNLSYSSFDKIIYPTCALLKIPKEIATNIKNRYENLETTYLKKKFTHRIFTEEKWAKKHMYQFLRYSKKNNFLNKVELVNHHKAHAYSAYCFSPFKNSLVVTFDGKGDFKSSTVSEVKNKKWKNLDYKSTFDSLGYFYGNVTQVLGFKAERHEGKTTGLAAFGKKTSLIKYFESFIKIKKNNFSINFCKDYMPYFSTKNQLPNFYKKLLKYNKKDIAYAAQYILEKAILTYIRKFLNNKKKQNICLAGGIFANVTLNNKILSLPGIKNIFIQPAMSDTGLPLGGIYAYLSKNSVKQNLNFNNVFLGPKFSKKQIINKLNKEKLIYKQVNVSSEIHNSLNKKKIIGLFQGRMEFGPRALCNRSIIYHAKDKTINDWLNIRLKRSEFMPFAPITIEDYASDCFIGWKHEHFASEFMTLTYKCTKEVIKNYPACVHIDNTARPQIIFKKRNPKSYKIFKDYFKKSKQKLLLNTSFNMHEKPILCDLDDAVKAIKNKTIDVLFIENFMISRN
tara:strand:+ start:2626 stop:4305 length:1680 start_codon:yes stop_codon:yes gene_type:complete